MKAKVNPDLLIWAREDAGFTLDEAAKRLRVAVDLLAAWEGAMARPTIPQMRRIAELYRRPLALFYMKERPSGFLVIHDFRRLPGEKAKAYSPLLRMEMRRAQERRRVALDLAEELDSKIEPFQLRCGLRELPDLVANRIRNSVGVKYAEQQTWRDPARAFREWRSRAERIGVLVFQTSAFPPSVARGFSVAEDLMPVIVISRKDAFSGRVFTLLHELAHVLLRRGGICDLHEVTRRPDDDDRIEVFCNAVAGSVLVPTESLLAHRVVASRRAQQQTWEDAEIEALATDFGCSRETVLRRLLILRKASNRFYELKRREYEEEREQAQKRRDKKPMKRNVPGETLSAFGRPFLTMALETYYQQRITLNDLSEILGIKSRHIASIEKRLAVPLE